MFQGGTTAAVLAAGLLGLRHGVDYDHVAAIADLTGAARTPARAIGLASTYALGHAVIIMLLGTLAVGFGTFLPSSADRFVETIVGLTLIVLGCYVLAAIARNPHNVTIVSRFVLISRASRYVVAKVRHFAGREPIVHDDTPPVPGARSAFGIGMIHGIGAETPTQLSLFVLSASVGGWAGGLLCVAAFVVGLLTMNVLMAVVSAGVFGLSSLRDNVYRAVMLLAGGYSVVVGALFIAGGIGLPIRL